MRNVFIKLYFKFFLWIYYRDISVVGIENIPQKEPALLIANHPNAIIDAAIVVSKIKRDINLTAKGTLGKIPILSGILRRNNVVFFHRKQDAQKIDRDAMNKANLMKCVKVLQNGDLMLIFPEGLSYATGGLHQFKLGVSRISKLYYEETGKVIPIIPIHLNYHKKEKMRSHVDMRIFTPVIKEKEFIKTENYEIEVTNELETQMREYEDSIEHDEAPQGKFKNTFLSFMLFLISLPGLIYALLPSFLILKLSNKISKREDAFATARLFLSFVLFPIILLIELSIFSVMISFQL
ncbi:MAG: 1-acyl-sn-glycerol-3-phosphate acyltransferase, partial [Candidatus Heimdallarchaeota archaeon]|nr:1-acyl-sn-glycerol-3-phosphate acyltransferase [Candidatus Heimdallarchaeota archaeon]